MLRAIYRNCWLQNTSYRTTKTFSKAHDRHYLANKSSRTQHYPKRDTQMHTLQNKPATEPTGISHNTQTKEYYIYIYIHIRICIHTRQTLYVKDAESCLDSEAVLASLRCCAITLFRVGFTHQLMCCWFGNRLWVVFGDTKY